MPDVFAAIRTLADQHQSAVAVLHDAGLDPASTHDYLYYTQRAQAIDAASDQFTRQDTMSKLAVCLVVPDPMERALARAALEVANLGELHLRQVVEALDIASDVPAARSATAGAAAAATALRALITT